MCSKYNITCFKHSIKYNGKIWDIQKTATICGCIIIVGDLTIETSVSDYLSSCSMHQIFIHSRKFCTKNLDFDVASTHYFFPHMGILSFQSFLMAICAIVMATFSTGIDSQSFQVSCFFSFDVTNPLGIQETTKFNHLKMLCIKI